MTANPATQAAPADCGAFEPFFDRIATWIEHRSALGRIPIAGKLAVTALVGLVFAATQLPRQKILASDRWSLLVLICAAMATVQYASHTLDRLRSALDDRLGPAGQPTHRDVVAKTLGDRQLAVAGAGFGTANTILGLAFGAPDPDLGVYGGYFLVGFVCGMAAWGIIGVVRTVATFTHDADIQVDYTSPDGCGGTSYLGNALLRFAGVTLIVGVGISVYILGTEWTASSPWITAVKWTWIGFPYLMSLYVLVAPATGVSQILQRHKVEREGAMTETMRGLRRRLQDPDLGSADRETLQGQYEYWASRRAELHRMRTWPFSVGANLRFAALNCSTMLTTGMGIYSGLLDVTGGGS